MPRASVISLRVHRRVQFGDFFQVGQVGDLARRDLQQRQVQRAQKPHAGNVEGGRQILDADGIAVFFQFPVRLKGEVQLADHLQLALGGAGGLLLVFRLLGKFAHHQFGHGGLELHDVGAALLGGAGHRFGHLQVAVVVDAGFGNNRNGHGILLSAGQD